MLSPKRDLIAAKLFLRLALSDGGPSPRTGAGPLNAMPAASTDSGVPVGFKLYHTWTAHRERPASGVNAARRSRNQARGQNAKLFSSDGVIERRFMKPLV